MAEDKQPSQPTIHVRQPPSTETKTIRTNDPVTNEAERRLAAEAEAGDEEEAKRIQKEQEEAAKEEQRKLETKVDFVSGIYSSKEGYVVKEGEENEGFDLALADGLVYEQNVQSGKGGLDVEERVFLSDKGFNMLRDVRGNESLTKKKK